MSAYRERLYPKRGSLAATGGSLPVRVLGVGDRSYLLLVEIERDYTLWEKAASFMKTGRADRLWLKRGMQLQVLDTQVHFDNEDP